jgi:hypothetical protein
MAEMVCDTEISSIIHFLLKTLILDMSIVSPFVESSIEFPLRYHVISKYFNHFQSSTSGSRANKVHFPFTTF